MPPNKKSQLEELKKKAAILGIDVDLLADELASRAAEKMPIDELAKKVAALIPADQKVDIDAIVHQASERAIIRVGTDLGGKLDEIRQGMTAASKGDTDALIKGVAALLQPVIQEQSQKSVEAIFQTNRKALVTEVGQQVDVKLAALQERAANPTEAAPGATGGGEDFITRLLPLAETLFDKWVEYKKVTSPPALQMDPLRMLVLGEKIGKGQLSVAEMVKDLSTPAAA